MSKQKPFNDDDFKSYAAGPVTYEVEMLFWLARIMSGESRLMASSDDDRRRLNNALVESYALHLRNILEFLHDRKRDKYVVAEQFCGDGIWEEIRKDKHSKIEEAWGRADIELAHLTEGRLPRVYVKKGWSPELAEAIKPVIEALATKAEPSRWPPSVLETIASIQKEAVLDKRVGVQSATESQKEKFDIVTMTSSSAIFSDNDGHSGRGGSDEKA